MADTSLGLKLEEKEGFQDPYPIPKPPCDPAWALTRKLCTKKEGTKSDAKKKLTCACKTHGWIIGKRHWPACTWRAGQPWLNGVEPASSASSRRRKKKNEKSKRRDPLLGFLAHLKRE